MAKKQRLELTWIGKEKREKLEPRVLIEDEAMSYAAPAPDGSPGVRGNVLIEGDNLLALRALESGYRNSVALAYYDPPYNGNAALGQYPDGVEHSLWLSMMRERIAITWRLLERDDGVLLISINDTEAHYLKVLCDEVCGRSSFVTSLVWFYEGNTDNQASIIDYHEYILVYSKTGKIKPTGVVDPNTEEGSKLGKAEIRNTIVKNGPKNPPSTIRLPVGFPANFEGGAVSRGNTNWPRYNPEPHIRAGVLDHDVDAYSGWSSRSMLERFIANHFEPIIDGKGQLTRFELSRTGAIEAVKIRSSEKGHFISVLRNFGTTNQMRIMLKGIGIKFNYPKPVDLIAYLVKAFTRPDGLVLDIFGGSGTTAHAVLKVNSTEGSRRTFIIAELDENTMRHVTKPRIDAAIGGRNAQGFEPLGGGYQFYRLAPSLLQKDSWGQYIISKEYKREMLSEAVCKLMGFTYAPSQEHFWQHGHAGERDFIYVTTQRFTVDALRKLSHEVGEGRTLLVCCRAHEKNPFDNLTVKKIPQAVMQKCEWGRDDYSLNIQEAPPEPITADDMADDEAELDDPATEAAQ